MSALGDPLVDLGILLGVLGADGAAGAARCADDGDRSAGLLHAGRDRRALRGALRPRLSDIRFYEIFAVFKIAVVIQQIYYRYVNGQTTDARFATFDARVAYLAQQAANARRHRSIRAVNATTEATENTKKNHVYFSCLRVFVACICSTAASSNYVGRRLHRRAGETR